MELETFDPIAVLSTSGLPFVESFRLVGSRTQDGVGIGPLLHRLGLVETLGEGPSLLFSLQLRGALFGRGEKVLGGLFEARVGDRSHSVGYPSALQ